MNELVEQDREFLCSILDPALEKYGEELYQPQPMKTFDEWKREIRENSIQKGQELLQRLGQAIIHLQNQGSLSDFEERFLTHLPEEGEKPSEERVTLQEWLDYDLDTIISCYDQGHSVFDKGDFSLAADIFLFCTTLQPLIAPFWLALGYAEERKGEMENALTAWDVCYNLDRENYTSLFCGAQLLRQNHRDHEAKEILHFISQKAAEKKEHRAFYEKAENLLKNWGQ